MRFSHPHAVTSTVPQNRFEITELMPEKTEKSFPPYNWLKPAAVSSVTPIENITRRIITTPLMADETIAAARPPSLFANTAPGATSKKHATVSGMTA